MSRCTWRRSDQKARCAAVHRYAMLRSCGAWWRAPRVGFGPFRYRKPARASCELHLLCRGMPVFCMMPGWFAGLAVCELAGDDQGCACARAWRMDAAFPAPACSPACLCAASAVRVVQNTWMIMVAGLVVRSKKMVAGPVPCVPDLCVVRSRFVYQESLICCSSSRRPPSQR